MNLKNTNPGRMSGEALRSLFKRPATIPYMGGRLTLDERCRGLLQYDPAQCVACGLCMRDCPTGALKVVNEGTREEKKMRAFLNTGKCIFCGQCVDSCARKSLSMSSKADLSQFAHDDLTVEL